ncbi:tailspike protein [Shewanella phage X14]|uniref:tailspike protein n=1 Tax=Shewanella phage X14 TaxID=2576871 RepID=UPI0023297899|nr:tailspike protein [Shewanella phage X14]ULR57009.1 tailspike protein [Shewanella phage X14]
MAVSIIGPKFYAWDRCGKPLAFGKLYTYQARTNTPKPTYQSEDQQVENTNPVILNGEGYANVYLDGSYKMVLKDKDENEIWSADPVTSAQAAEWVNCQSAFYVSPSSFVVSGNLVEEFEIGRKVRVDNQSSEFSYSTINSAVFASGETTVSLSDAVVLTSISEVCISVIGPDSTPSNITKTFPTLVGDPKSAVNDNSIRAGDIIIVSERKDGEGGFSSWLATPTLEVSPNSYNIVQSSVNPDLSFVLKTNDQGVLNARAAGFIADGSTDNRDALEAIKNALSGIVELFFDFGTYSFSQIDLLDTPLVLSGLNRRATLKGIAASPYSDFIRIGSSSQIFTNSYLKGLKLEGVNREQTGVVIKNLTGVGFDVEMTNFSALIKNLGGLSYQFKNFKGSDYGTGFQSRKSEGSDSVTVYNNHIQFVGQTQITGGEGKAIDHDEGYGLYFEKLQLDFCGTSSVLTTGGIFVGPNVGQEVSLSSYPGVVIDNAVLEGVKGRPLYVQSGSVVIKAFSGFANEDKYVFETTDSVCCIDMVDGSGNGQIEIVASNNKAVFINTTMTNGITGIGGGDISPFAVLINSGNGSQAQNGFLNLALQSLYVGGNPTNKLSDANYTIDSTLGGVRRADDPASGPDSVGYQYMRTNNYASQDGWRHRSRSHSWHTHTNAFQMGVNENGDVAATSFTPFTGVHYFVSDEKIDIGMAVDLIDFSQVDVLITVEAVINDEGEIVEPEFVAKLPFKANGIVSISSENSKVCAGIVHRCEKIKSGYLVYVAAVGDNYSGELKGFLVEGSPVAGDILCTGSNGKLKVAPKDIEREVVTFKAMSGAKNGSCYGYF